MKLTTTLEKSNDFIPNFYHKPQTQINKQAKLNPTLPEKKKTKIRQVHHQNSKPQGIERKQQKNIIDFTANSTISTKTNPKMRKRL